MRVDRGAPGRVRWSGYWLALLLLATALGIAIFDRDSGIGSWLLLRADLSESRQRIDALRRANDALRVDIRALREDPFRLERAIREDLELVKPGEVVVLFEGRGLARVPDEGIREKGAGLKRRLPLEEPEVGGR